MGYIENIKLSEVGKCDWNYAGIYKITNEHNKKSYIGQSINLRGRLMDHINNIDNSVEGKLYDAIRKYGIEIFQVQIVIILNIWNKTNSEIKEELNAQECFYISLYDTYTNGYNATPGGDSGRLGFKHSQETINKIKKAHKNYTPKVAIDKMKIVYGYDLKNKTFIEATSINNAFLKTGVDYRSISQICNNYSFMNGGRFIASKQFLFSFSKEELKKRIEHYYLKHD